MQTIETGKAVVDIIVWPSNRPWTSRYATSYSIVGDTCTLVLTEHIFRDPKRANTAYKRFARRMQQEGFTPQSVLFHQMTSAASKGLFCVLSPKQSLFNSACPLGRMTMLDVGSDDKRMVMAMVKSEAGEA